MLIIRFPLNVKTDPVDARVLCEYAARMLWVPWQPPSAVAGLLP